MRNEITEKRLGRRGLLGLAAAGAGVAGLALAGCGSDDEDKSGSAATSAASTSAAQSGGSTPKKTVNITYWGAFTGNLGEAEKTVVDRFNSSQTEVAVDYQSQNSYEDLAQKLTAALASNTQPDVALLSDVWWFKFYLAGALTPLDPLFAELKVDPKDYEPSLFNEGVRKGKNYWVPFARSTPLFYYNRDMFKAAGLPDKAPETWDELIQIAPKLMKEGGAKSAFAHITPYSAWTFQAVIRQFGGRYSDDQFNIMIDQPAGVQAGNFWRQSVIDGWASTPQSNTTDFQTGQVATTMASTGSLAGITQNAKFNFGTALLPRSKEFNVCTGGAGLAIMAKASDERKQAAMKFITFATNPEITTFWSQKTGYMPVRVSAVQGKEMQDYFKANPNFEVAVKQLPRAQPQDAARVFIPNGDIIIGKGIEEIVINKKDAKDAFGPVASTLKTEAKPVLDQVKQREG